MAQTIDNPLKFLEQVRQEAVRHAESGKKLESLRGQQRQCEKKLERSRKRLEEKVQKRIVQRREDLLSSYDVQISQTEQRLRKTGAARNKARSQGVKGRIFAETADLVKENQDLKKRMAAVFRADRVPAFCRTGIYYSLFHPQGFREWMVCFLMFGILFAFLPILVFCLLPWQKLWILVLIYLADIVLAGGIYLKLNNITRIRYADTIREGRMIRNRIRRNRKKIRTLTREIKSDENEEEYNLKEYDDELAKAKQELTELIRKKQEAENTFETVTRNIIADEVEGEERPELERQEAELAVLNHRLLEEETRYQQEQINLAADYGAYIGAENLSPDRIRRLEELIRSGEVSGLEEAVERLRDRKK